MAVTTQLRYTHPKEIVQLAQAQEDESVASHLAGRLIQITLAIYLLPALMAVFVVGGVGICLLKFGQLLTGPIQRSVEYLLASER
jgi:serine kinase of HPr protein (carbohydrate metabolism regulator)